MEAYLGSILLMAIRYEPPGFFKCDGRTLSISQYPALYSLLGTSFGGDGTTNFALPKMESPIGSGASYFICSEGIYPARQ